jgi:hypothetical protein
MMMQFCSVCGTTILAKSVNKDDPRMGVNVSLYNPELLRKRG